MKIDLVLCALGLLVPSCDRRAETVAPPVQPSAPVEQKHPNDDKQLAPDVPITVGDIRSGFKFIEAMAKKEEDDIAAQTKSLDAKVTEIQGFITAGRYDDAELKLTDIYWKPVAGAGTLQNNEYREQYDAKRKSLASILARKRKAQR
jgi:hypothetical protein